MLATKKKIQKIQKIKDNHTRQLPTEYTCQPTWKLKLTSNVKCIIFSYIFSKIQCNSAKLLFFHKGTFWNFCFVGTKPWLEQKGEIPPPRTMISNKYGKKTSFDNQKH